MKVIDSRQLRTAIAVAALACMAAAAPERQPGSGAVIRASQSTLKNPVAATPESLEAGRELYQRNCASCHGANGEGGPGNDLIPAAPSLVDGTFSYGSTDGAIFESIRNGIAPEFNMVPWKDKLKDDQIWNVVNYIRSIAKKK